MAKKSSVSTSQMVVPFFFLGEALKETLERTARDNNVKWSLKAQKGKHRTNQYKCSEITEKNVIFTS